MRVGLQWARISVSTRARPSAEAATARWIAVCRSSQRCSPFSAGPPSLSPGIAVLPFGRTIRAWRGKPTCTSQRWSSGSGPLALGVCTNRWAKLVRGARASSRIVRPRLRSRNTMHSRPAARNGKWGWGPKLPSLAIANPVPACSSAASALAMQASRALPWRCTPPQKVPRASVSTEGTCSNSAPSPQRRARATTFSLPWRVARATFSPP